jgi:hypothetical protein
MPVTRGSSAAAGGQRAESDTQTPNLSLAHAYLLELHAEVPAKRKRKATDLNLKTITIDTMYDLTLIVGTLEHPKGQMAFQVNKGSFRNVSVVWSKILNGNWAESGQSEISFPDDSCEAFLIMLRIAHFQLPQLPTELSREELVDLATLTDKCQLENAVRIGLELKKWIEPYQKMYVLWPANTHLQEFAVMASSFKLENEFGYLVSRLAMEVEVDEAGHYFYMTGNAKHIELHSYLPTCISGKYFTQY